MRAVLGVATLVLLAGCVTQSEPVPVAVTPAPAVVYVEKPAPPPKVIIQKQIVEKPVYVPAPQPPQPPVVVEKHIVVERPGPTVVEKKTVEKTIVVRERVHKSTSRCTRVKPYRRKDGTLVRGYVRCRKR